MLDILHRVGIRASAKQVYDTLTTIEGNRHWWVSDCQGDAAKGGIIDFGFITVKVVEAKPGKLVKWKVLTGPIEWMGTVISFQLVRKMGQTFVIFKHAGWKKPVEFMHHCSTKWAVFLFSLMYWLERGEGRPVPYDVKVHFGD